MAILPDHPEQIKLKKPYETAAGPIAVAVSLLRGYKQMTAFECTKGYLKLNQTEGFDCPSCAWPDPRPGKRSPVAEYCEAGAKAVAEEATTAKADPDWWAAHGIDELMTWSERDIGKAGRITHPMIKRKGSNFYEPIDWADAFQLIADELNACADPDEAIFYTSGRTSNEPAFLYQLFARKFGTNNLPDCSNMCHEATSVALAEDIGIGKGTVQLEDLHVAELILIFGQNPGTNAPRMLSALKKCKENGGKIVSINPLPEAGLLNFRDPQSVKGWVGPKTVISDLYLQVRVNQDMALCNAILRVLLDMEDAEPGTVFDHEFIETYTSGFAEMIAHLRPQDPAALAAQAGVELSKVVETAMLIKARKRMIICWAMGITQHTNGTDNVKAILNILLARGAMGQPGAGACPVRGHSNVQGDRTVGIWHKVKPEWRSGLKKHFNCNPPEQEGLGAIPALEAMARGEKRVFVSLGGNLLLAAPDTNMAAEAMRRTKLTVMISTKPNRNHLVTGETALILPVIGRTEKDFQQSGKQFQTNENSMGVVCPSHGVLDPPSEHLLSEPAIVALLAYTTLGNDETIDWLEMANNYDHIRDAIEKVIPGFPRYNERIRKPGGFNLPNPASERTFETSDGKAHFNAITPNDWVLAPDEYLMTTLRSHDQFNTTIYGYDDRYRGIHNGRRIVMMHRDDIAAAGLQAGDHVHLSSNYDGQVRTSKNYYVVEYSIPSGCVATYFPEANELIPSSLRNKKAEIPSSKSVVVRVEGAAFRA